MTYSKVSERFTFKKLSKQALGLSMNVRDNYQGLAEAYPDDIAWGFMSYIFSEFCKSNDGGHLFYTCNTDVDERGLCVTLASYQRGYNSLDTREDTGIPFLTIRCAKSRVAMLFPPVKEEAFDHLMEVILAVNGEVVHNCGTLILAGLSYYRLAGWAIVSIDINGTLNTYAISFLSKDRKSMLTMEINYYVLKDDYEYTLAFNKETSNESPV